MDFARVGGPKLGAAFLLRRRWIFHRRVFGIRGRLVGRRYDDVAMVETFFVLPLAFLSGAYYAPESLSSPWRELTLANPFTGFVAGFRGGFAADAAAAGAGVFLFAPAAFGFAYWLFRIGYKIRQ